MTTHIWKGTNNNLRKCGVKHQGKAKEIISKCEEMLIGRKNNAYSRISCPPGHNESNFIYSNMTIDGEENIKKARRSAYGLFGGGYHGNNGLYPDTLIHLCVRHTSRQSYYMVWN